MSKHDDFWVNDSTDADIADPNISTETTVDAIVAGIDAPDLKSILEFGCGYGRLTLEIKKRYPDAYVAGFDINPKVITQAEEYSGWHANAELPDDQRKSPTEYPFYYCRGDLKGIPKQDAIYSVQVFQHLPNERKQAYIKEFSAALKRGGLLRIQYVEGDSDTFLTHDAKFIDMANWLRDAGLEVASVEHNLIVPRWTWVTAVKE